MKGVEWDVLLFYDERARVWSGRSPLAENIGPWVDRTDMRDEMYSSTLLSPDLVVLT